MNNNKLGDDEMIEQTARVVSTKQGGAWVIPQGAASCGGCQSKSGCSSLGGLFGFFKPEMEKLYVANPLHAKPGDQVVIGMQGNAFLMYSILAYLLPLVSMVVFAVFGSHLFPWLEMSGELGAVLAGVAGLLSGFKLAGWMAIQVARSEDARPVILRHQEQVIYPIGAVSHV